MQEIHQHAQRAQEYMLKVVSRVEHMLEKHLPPENLVPQDLHKAMRYSVFAGGKRLRPALVMATFEAFGGKDDSVYYATSALEMLHTFSLIHDDLPCMDDDDFRRGRPTVHKVYGEATAVLAGDALCIHAFGLLARTGNSGVVHTIAQALGTSGMLGGQMVDIQSEGKSVDVSTVRYIHEHKTAALIEASLAAGAMLAGATEDEIKIIHSYGRCIGLAFQVVDDILDIEQTTEQLGKSAGSDVARGKATYPSVLGLAASKEIALELYKESLLELDKLAYDVTVLRDIAAFIVTRVN